MLTFRRSSFTSNMFITAFNLYLLHDHGMPRCRLDLPPVPEERTQRMKAGLGLRRRRTDRRLAALAESFIA